MSVTNDMTNLVASKIGTSATEQLIKNATTWASTTDAATRQAASESSQAIFASAGLTDLYSNNRTIWDWSTYSIPTTSSSRSSRSRRVSDPTVTFNKHEYSVGLYDIKARLMAYQNSGIYVSKPFDVMGNIIEVELDAFETHPVFDNQGNVSDKQTSIEYYVTYTDSPTIEQWLPILPKQQLTVDNELLIFNSGTVATLRFAARIDAVVSVYENGKKLQNYEWEIHPDRKHVQIAKSKFIPAHKYTISYAPSSTLYNPWIVNLVDNGLDPIIKKETITGGTNRNGTVYLSSYPYVDIENDSDPIKVKLINANIASPPNVGTPYQEIGWEEIANEPFTKNITNYTGMNTPLKDYDIVSDPAYLGFEYFHDGNQLQFTETFHNSNDINNREINHGDADLEVEYKVLSPTIRLKAILRNTSTEALLTPVLHKYVIHFNIMR